MKIIQSLRDMIQPEPQGGGVKPPGSVDLKNQRPEPEKGNAPGAKSPTGNKFESKPGEDARAKDETEAKGKTDAVGAKPALLIPEAPKPAEWRSKAAREDWCPPSLAERHPELKAHVYEDNYAIDRILDDSWRVVGATRRGKMHAHNATHREDAFAFQAGPNFVVLCVADGAGSAKLSRLGSHAAVMHVTDYLGRRLAQPPAGLGETPDKLALWLKAQVSAAAQAACLLLRHMALEAQAAPRDFRCTLLTAALFQSGKNAWLLTNQIGDGAILALFKDKSTRRFGSADSGEFSGEVACFVPDECADKKALEVHVATGIENLECLLLCSDGIEDPFYPMDKNAPGLFQQFYGGVKEKLPDFSSQPIQGPILAQESAGWALGQWLGFEKRGENDDRSLLLLHRHPATLSF